MRYNRRARRNYKIGGMMPYHIARAKGENIARKNIKDIEDELNTQFDIMYPQDSDDESIIDDDEYEDAKELFEDDLEPQPEPIDNLEEYEIEPQPISSDSDDSDDAFEQKAISKKTLRRRRSAKHIIKRRSSSVSILSKLDIRIKKEVHVILDSELCEIIPFGCRIPGYRLYTLIFEISLNPFKYMRLKDVIVNEKRLSESMPLLLSAKFGNFNNVIYEINRKLFLVDIKYIPEDFLEEHNLNVNIGLIQSYIKEGNVYEKDTNIFMIETLSSKNKYTLILDFNRESQKTNLDIILRPDVTVTKCNREDSTNHCEGLTETTPCKKINCRISNNTRSRAATRLQSRYRGNRARTLNKRTREK